MPTRGPALLAALALIWGLSFALAPWAVAQEDAPPAQPANVTAEGWYTAQTSDVLPPALFNEFPPELVCIVRPEFCDEDAQQLTDPIDGVVTGVEAPGGPVQPVPPGALPVGLSAGQPRYTSYLAFDLPDAPANAFVERFELVLHESHPGFAMESPGFREVVRSIVHQYPEETRGQGPFQRLLEEVSSGDAPLLDPAPTGIEACPAVGPFTEGENQDAAEQPDRDCVFGANGARSDDGVWTFDLTFAMQGWLDGALDFHGVYLGPIGPENLEYGDPDFSANFVIYLAGAEADEGEQPSYGFAASEGFDPGPGPPPAPAPADPGTGFTPAPAPRDDFAPAPQESFPGEAPDIARPAPSSEAAPPQAAAPPTEPVSTTLPALVWLLLPLGLTSALLFARALDGQPVPVAATRAGALTRLTRRP